MIREYNRKLVLENGIQMDGYAFGAEGTHVVEAVFNTSMVGYQEILSDPSYTDQAVVFCYPMIGNYGMNSDDFETKRPTIGGFIVREYCEYPSNWRCSRTLSDVMKQYDIPGIEGVDTRALTRIIRENGTMRAVICDPSMSLEEALDLIEKTPVPHDQVPRVSSKEVWTSD